MLRYDFDMPGATEREEAKSQDLSMAAWRAASVLLNTPQAEAAHTALSNMLAVYMMDGRAIDPKVVAWTVIDTGSCRVYMREPVPLSTLLLARIWRLQFPLQVTPKSAMVPVPATELMAAPWDGDDTDNPASKAQSIGLAEAVQQRMETEDENTGARVKAFFTRLGLLSTDEVCAPFILQGYQEGLASALNGTETAKRARFE